MTEANEQQRAMPHLSPRQQQCLRGVLALKSAKQIARDLGISPHAVEKHLRIAREKYGAASSADAARMFLAQREGNEFPHSGHSDLAPRHSSDGKAAVLEPTDEPSNERFEDNNGALSPDQPLTPRQTLLTIFAVSLGTIVGLLLLVACAEGIERLVSG